MKKLSLSILALVMSIAFLQAQEKYDSTSKDQRSSFHKPHGKHGMKPGKHHMDFKQLNLTQDQQNQIKSINSDFRAKVADLKKNEATTTVKDHKAQMRQLNKQKHEKMQQVFTQEQKDQLAKMRKDARKNGDKIAKNRMEKMKTELQLSDDQSAKIKALRADTKTQIKTIRENKALTDDQKKEQVTAAFKKQHDVMNSLLTPEQVKKMENLKPGRIHNNAK